MWSQNVPVSASMIREKAVIIAKELNIENIQASDGWLPRWKEKNSISFKTVLRESKSAPLEMVNAWSETSLPTLLQTMTWKTLTTRINSDFFISAFQIKTKLTSWSQKSAMRES